MDLRLNEQQALLQDSVARFLRHQYSFERRRGFIAEAAPADPGLWTQIVELGWVGAWLPEELGGFGGTEIEFTLIAEQIGRSLYVGPYLPVSLAAALLRSTRSEKARALLATIAGGELRAVVAHAEPGGRGHLDAVGLQARRAADGVVLTGRKRIVMSGQFADMLLVSAVLDGQLIVATVDPDQSGLTRLPLRTVDNDWACDVEFRDVAAAVIVDGLDAQTAINDHVYFALLGSGAEALGLCEAAAAVTLEYLKARHQFGRPLADFQALQHRLADMVVKIEQLRGSMMDALAQASTESTTRMAAAFAIKVQAGGVAQYVAGECLHLHGGMGMTDEMPISHYYRRARTLEVQFGNSDYYLNAYAQLFTP